MRAAPHASAGASRSRIVTFILAGGRGQRLDPLTVDRPKPSVPVGGRYRLIDFTLSNCLNSGLTNVYVLVQHLSAELITYVHDGWRPYFPSTLGDNLQAIPPQFAEGEHGYRGTADALLQNRALIERTKATQVVVLAGDHIYKMDYRGLLTAHRESGAELTVSAADVPVEIASQFGIMTVAAGGRIERFVEKPVTPEPSPDDPHRCLASMGVYVFNAARLLTELERDRTSSGSHDVGHDVVPAMVREGVAAAFRFAEPDRSRRLYWRDVGTLDAYYDANMDLVAVNPELNLYDAEWPVRTAPLVAPPAKFVHDEPDRVGLALSSVVSPGCIVSGARLSNSVVGVNTRIHSWAIVEGAVLLDGVQIGRGARVRRAILDRGVSVPAQETVGYDDQRDRERFVVTPGGVTVVSRTAAEAAWTAPA